MNIFVKHETILDHCCFQLLIIIFSNIQEERDAYIGQIFGLVTLGRAICLAKEYNNVN